MPVAVRGILWILSICLFSPLVALGEDTGNPKQAALGPLATKVDSRLIRALRDASSPGSNALRATQRLKSAKRFALASTKNPAELAIRLECDASPATVDRIRAAGATIIHASPRWKSVDATAPLQLIETLAALDGIESIRLSSGYLGSAQGSVANEAEVDLKADIAKNAFGLDGTGQKVGVLSDSVNALIGGTVQGSVPTAILVNSGPQMTGDLPPQVEVLDFGPSANDEGAGMLELIYDIAPGAKLAFASAANSQVSFAENITRLRTISGCTVITDDLFYFEEPLFQDGPIAQAITENAAAGVPHFCAAGNFSDSGLLSSYKDVNPAVNNSTADGSDFHDWGIGGATPSFLPIAIVPGESLVLILQWNEPYRSFNLGAGSRVDLDVYLFDAANAGANIVAAGDTLQGSDLGPLNDPLEVIEYQNTTGSTQFLFIAIDHVAGRRNIVFRSLFFLNDSGGFPSGGVNGPTIYGHPATKECICVGAVATFDVSSGGGFFPDFVNVNAEFFSAKGGLGANGIPYYFGPGGKPLYNNVERRDKPDIAAVDGVNNTVFGFDFDGDPAGAPNFFGTSAAAPNAAAAAALLLQRAPGTTPDQLKRVLQASAIDIIADDPVSGPGPDDRTGAGLIDINAAIALVPSITSPLTAAANDGSPFTYTIDATNTPTAFSATGLPPGLTVNTATGVITGTPRGAAVYTVTITAANNVGTDRRTLTLTVNVAPPALPAGQVAEGTVGVPISFTPVIDGTPPFTIASTGLPAGLSFTGTTLTGTPTSPGDFPASLTITNAQGSATGTLTVRISPSVAPTITSALTISAILGGDVLYTPTASGSQPITFSVTTLPAGLAFDGLKISGRPTVAGSFAVSLTATNAGGTQTVMLVISVDDEPLADDSDNDGFTTSVELAAGTSTSDAASNPTGSPTGRPQPLTVKSLKITLNFKKTNADQISLSGTLALASSPAGKRLLADIGGVTTTLTLDAKGTAKSSDKTISAKVSTKKLDAAAFTVTLKKGAFAATLMPLGFVNASITQSQLVPVTVLIDQTAFRANVLIQYKGKAGSSGRGTF